MAGTARSAASSPARTSSAACLKLHGEKASSAGRTSRSGAGPEYPTPRHVRKRPSVHGDADHVVRTKIACGLDGDRVDDRAVDELSPVDLDRRKDSRYRRARVGGAHRIAARQHDRFPRRGVACDCCARIVQVSEVTSIDHLRQEVLQAVRVEHSVSSHRRADELPPAQRLADVGHLVDRHTARVREADDRTRACSANDIGPNRLAFQDTEDADVREATCSPATERQPDARHLPLTPTELTGGTTVTSPRSARASASDVPNCRVDDRARK